jgi:hypothetical protein
MSTRLASVFGIKVMDIVMRPWIAPYRTSWTAPPSYLEESLLLACIQSLSPPPLEDWVGFNPPVVRAMAAVPFCSSNQALPCRYCVVSKKWQRVCVTHSTRPSHLLEGNLRRACLHSLQNIQQARESTR